MTQEKIETPYFIITPKQTNLVITGGDDVLIGPFVHISEEINGILGKVYVGAYMSSILKLVSEIDYTIEVTLVEKTEGLTLIAMDILITPKKSVQHKAERTLCEFIFEPKEIWKTSKDCAVKITIDFNEKQTGDVNQPKRGTKVIPPDGSGVGK
jgi:hypothetical protein